MDLQLQGKTALVSGSSGGIGFAIAKRLAAEGAAVTVNGRRKEQVERAVESIRATYPQAKLSALVADLSGEEGAQVAFAQVPDVDILVNNLGVYEPKPFGDITDKDWLTIFEVNVLSGVRLSRHYMPGMMKRNQGRIVFISSESAVNIPVEMIHYGMTKTAQISIARGLAEMTAGTNVTVNSVLPGPTMSEGVEQFIADNAAAQGVTPQQVEKDFFKTMRPGSLIKRFATTDEVANMVAYVASPLSSATNGAALRVEGGLVKSIL